MKNLETLSQNQISQWGGLWLKDGGHLWVLVLTTFRGQTDGKIKESQLKPAFKYQNNYPYFLKISAYFIS